jgi:hypothetical protein
MGREATGTIRTAEGKGKAKVLLETEELIFRGEVRAKVPFRALTVIEPGPGGLRLVWPDGEAVVDLSDVESSRWADRIRNPPGLLDKLGVKDGTRVAVLEPDYDGFADPDFAAALATRRVERVPDGPADVVVWGLDDVGDLARLVFLIGWIHPAGALWAVWRKGQRDLNENHVREAALDAGLVDVKVARFSATHSALKLVVPRSKRGI